MKPTETMRETCAGPEGILKCLHSPLSPLGERARMGATDRDTKAAARSLRLLKEGPFGALPPPKALDFEGTSTTPYPLLN